MRPLVLDLCCGRGAVTRAYLAAGFNVVGVDILEHPDYPPEATFILADVRTWDPSGLPRPWAIWASAPCDEFSRHRMPWTRARATEPDLSIVEACYRIREAMRPEYFIMENVREAQRWLGPAVLHRAERYLWGDVVLAPKVTARSKESFSSARKDLRAEVPFALVYPIASMQAAAWRLLTAPSGEGGARA